MELYIPPPMHYLPRPMPVRPPVPTVPVVPTPELPDVLHAPEGAYRLAKELFPEVERPGPLPADTGPARPAMTAGNALMAGPAFVPLPTLSSPNIYAVSTGATLVNGQWQPGYACRPTFADVWYPSRIPGKESSFGALVRLGLGKRTNTSTNIKDATKDTEPEPVNVYEDDFSDSASDRSDLGPAHAPAPAHEQLQLPGAGGGAQSGGKKGYLGKSDKNKKQDKSLSSSRGGIITRVSPNINLGSIMDDKGKNGGERVRWAFWNMGRLFCWAEEGGNVMENLATVVFQTPPTAHAISHLTVGPERQDIVVGLESGDLVYLDFINDRTERFNIGGKIIKSAVTGVHFDPRGGDRFLVSFADNSMAQYHLFAEDPTDAALAVITSLPRPWTTLFEAEEVASRADEERAAEARAAAGEGLSPASPNGNPGAQAASAEANGSATPARTPGAATPLPGAPVVPGTDRQPFLDKLIEWKNDEWKVPESERDKKGEKYPWAGKNPLLVAQLGCKSSITSMAYSPDGRWLAVTTKDGMLRLLDTEENRVTDVFESYFASLTCSAWSPDSRFVAVGGQDDLVTIYSPRESRLVARCQGHTGFVTCIAFDPTMRSEGRGYRFGSVGEDGKLLLWDFSAAALRKPRHQHHHHSSISYGAGSTASLPLGQRANLGPVYHPPPPKSEVAMLQPVLARVVEGNLMTSLHFGPKTIATVSRAGSIKVWTRPPRPPRAKRRKDKDKAGE